MKWILFIGCLVINTVHANVFFKDHGLVLFFSSQCQYCRAFSPVIKVYGETHKADILPLSFDNQGLAEFPDFLPASSDWVIAAFNGNPITYPALFIANIKLHRLYPVSMGSMDLNELEMRMNTLMPKIDAYERESI